MMFLFHLTYRNPRIKHCGRAALEFQVQVLTSWGVKRIYAGTSFNALCSENKRFLFLPSYILGSDWVVLAAAPQNTEPELRAYSFSTKDPQTQRFPKQWSAMYWEVTGTPKSKLLLFSIKIWGFKFACQS